jgi:N-succinyldiaminopimelate aminotransferase
VNPNLARLQPYPFEKLRQLFSGASPTPAFSEIRLSIGEPQHGTPRFIQQTLTDNLAGLAHYPITQGADDLRAAIAAWLGQRYRIPVLNLATQILPVNGSREALFAFAQCIADADKPDGVVVCPNPFYQIYEGAAFLAGLQPAFLNQLPHDSYAMNFATLPKELWQRAQLIYVCSPGNPTGSVMTLEEWRVLFELSDRHGFVIASDECYSEIYFDETAPPLGGLQAAHQLGRDDYHRLIVFSSLSKRSNVPGLRSGFVAGDATLIEKFRLYRTYHGCAMSPPVQAASAAAWRDEAHVCENRHLYSRKFAQVTPVLASCLDMQMPAAGFYHWASVARYGITDTEFARRLHTGYNVTVLPGSFLARTANGINPGTGFIRIALVAEMDECMKAAHRIANFCATLHKTA